LEVFLIFGFFKTIKTDAGKEFNNQLVTHMCKICRIDHNVIIPDNHEVQGRAERQHDTVRTVLKKKIIASKLKDKVELSVAVANNLVLDKTLELTDSLEDLKIVDSNWQDLIPGVALAMNCRVHATTLTTPFVLMFGRPAIGTTVQGAQDTASEDVNHDFVVHF
jgi:hypothetical protein